jgi:hypothetical protein
VENNRTSEESRSPYVEVPNGYVAAQSQNLATKNLKIMSLADVKGRETPLISNSQGLAFTTGMAHQVLRESVEELLYSNKSLKATPQDQEMKEMRTFLTLSSSSRAFKATSV